MGTMHQIKRRGAVVFSLALLAIFAGCSKNESPDSAEGGAQEAAAESVLPGTTEVTVETQGQGYTRDAAVDDALAMAVAQVNGRSFSGGSATKVRGAIKEFEILDEEEVLRKIPERTDNVTVQANQSASSSVEGSYAESGSGSASARNGRDSAAFSGSYSANGSASASSESESKLSITESSKGKERVWQIKVKAVVLKYSGGADAGKPRVVIADPRASQASFEIGEDRASAAAISDRIKGEIAEQIGKSNRFLVIDRGYTDEMDAELQTALGDNANPADVVRLGQRLTADIVVIPSIKYFEYKKNVRVLRLSGKELVSYSGGFKGDVAVVNVSTGQMLMKESLAIDFPTTEPRVWGPGVNAQSVVDDAIAGLTEKFVTALIRKTFPISIVSLEGNSAVLSQGGAAIKQGTTYELVRLGNEVIDPQTKVSLGKIEHPAGTITVTRVEQNMSYGDVTLNAPLASGEFKQGMFQVRSEVVPVAASTAPAASQSGAAASAGAAPARRAPAQEEEEDDFFK